MYYAVIVDDEKGLVSSNKELISFGDTESKGLLLTTDEVNVSGFSRQGVLDFLDSDQEIDIYEVYHTLKNYITDHIFFKDARHATLMALWTIGTYVYRVFRYYPYIHLTAAKASGKTLLLEVLEPVAFNGKLAGSVTAPVLFRYTHNNSPTLLVDEVERLRKQDKETRGELMSILNSGFCKSGSAMRCEQVDKK